MKNFIVLGSIVAGLALLLGGTVYFSWQTKVKRNTLSQISQIQSIGFSQENATTTSSTTEALSYTANTADTLVYRRDKKSAFEEKGAQEYVFFNIPKQTKEVIDFTKKYDVRPEVGSVPILYIFESASFIDTPVRKVTAYDFKYQYQSEVEVSTTDVSLSSVVMSPFSPQIGYCSDDKEGTFYLLDLILNKKKSYPQFSGCPSDGNSYNPPQFSLDGKYVYYQDFGTFNVKDESGVTNDAYDYDGVRFRELNVGTGENVEASTLMLTPERISFSQKKFANVETCHPESGPASAFASNCIRFFSLKQSDGDVYGRGLEKGEEVGRIVFPLDGIWAWMMSQSGDTLYVGAVRGGDIQNDDAPRFLYVIDMVTGKVKKQISVHGEMSLLVATDSYLAFKSGKNYDLYVYDTNSNAVVLVEETPGVSRFEGVYAFVKKEDKN